ncbi:MAG: M28 family peptidase [Saprospiraceae bacterium]|nr:M28 family peptidase [Saprospiraceae bacterium]
MKKSFLPICLLLSSLTFAQNLPPVLSNVQVQLMGNNSFVISYDLTDAESDPVTVSFRAAAYGASALDYNTANATGDIGAGIAPGTGKQIEWDFSAYAAQAPNDFRLMLVADDLQSIDIQSLVDQVDSTRLIGDLSFIEGIRHRTAGAAHLQEVKDLIWFQFLDRGLETYQQSFTFGSYDAQNIIGRHPGTGETGETYLLGGHFDTVADAPGADDNGSAVAGVLEAMRILSQYPTKKSIKFIGFDLEEANLVGSTRYVSNGILNGESVAGMIDFEMIGYYTEAPNSQTLPAGFNLLFPDAYNAVASQDFKGNFITNVGKVGSSATLMQNFQAASAAYVPALRSVSVEAPAAWQSLTPDLGRSDHAPFWLANRPAIMLTDGANFRNPNYHTPGDTLGTINFTFMANVVKGTVATLAQLAEVHHADTWWVDTDFFTPTNEAFDCGINISPNPARDLLLIDWTGCTAAIQRLTLLDALGRTVLTANPTGANMN